MWKCVSIYTHTHIFSHILHSHIYIFTHTCILSHTCTYFHSFTHIHILSLIGTNTQIIYIYIYTHTHIQWLHTMYVWTQISFTVLPFLKELNEFWVFMFKTDKGKMETKRMECDGEVEGFSSGNNQEKSIINTPTRCEHCWQQTWAYLERKKKKIRIISSQENPTRWTCV